MKTKPVWLITFVLTAVALFGAGNDLSASPRAAALDSSGEILQRIATEEIRTETAFALRDQSFSPHEHSVYAVARGVRSSDDGTLEITITQLTDEARSDNFWARTIPSNTTGMKQAPVSGHPLGAGCRSTDSASRVRVSTFDGKQFVAVSVTYRGRTRDHRDGYRVADREGDQIAVEGLARRTLARLRSLDATPASPTRIGNADVPTLTGPRGEKLVNIDAYARARGYRLTVNARQGICSFRVGETDVVVPLAARGIKVGARWVETRDISLSRDGLWYVPLAALEGVRG